MVWFLRVYLFFQLLIEKLCIYVNEMWRFHLYTHYGNVQNRKVLKTSVFYWIMRVFKPQVTIDTKIFLLKVMQKIRDFSVMVTPFYMSPKFLGNRSIEDISDFCRYLVIVGKWDSQTHREVHFFSLEKQYIFHFLIEMGEGGESNFLTSFTILKPPKNLTVSNFVQLYVTNLQPDPHLCF